MVQLHTTVYKTSKYNIAFSHTHYINNTTRVKKLGLILQAAAFIMIRKED